MTLQYIEYGDNGKVAREKINSIMAEVEASIPSIWENGDWYIGGIDTWITAVGLELRETNNLIRQDSNHKTFTDLQLAIWITPTSPFPVGVLVGNVESEDWWEQWWVLLNAKTTEWSYVRRLYGDDWKLYFDWWLWVFKEIPNSDDLTNAVQQLRSELHRVAFTGKSSDLDNDADFSSVPVMTEEQYEDTPWTSGDNKRYFIYYEE